MNRHMDPDPDSMPTTDAQLFDLLHSLLGVGDHEPDGEVPWWKFRATEIAKLKAMRKKRGISLVDLTFTARYCVAHQISVTQTWQLCQQITPAKREARANHVSALAEKVNMAIEVERALPGPDTGRWVEKLLLSRGPLRQIVLDEWTLSRKEQHAHEPG